MSQPCSKSEALSSSTYSSKGQLCKIFQWMHESIDQGLVWLILLGYAAEEESFIYITFFFKLSHDSYLWMEEWMGQPLVFMAYDVGDITIRQLISQMHGNFFQVFIKEVNGHVNNGEWELILCSKVQREWNQFQLWGLCLQKGIWLPTRWPNTKPF